MAPPIEKVRLASVLYSVEILSGEMETIRAEIEATKLAISELNAQLVIQSSNLTTQQTQLMTLYIQSTGSFPSAV